jgi:hypothetical protein
MQRASDIDPLTASGRPRQADAAPRLSRDKDCGGGRPAQPKHPGRAGADRPPGQQGHDESGVRSLVVSSIASAAAAVVIHGLWTPGTIPAAALTPVLVELFAEGLRRPARRFAGPRARQDVTREPRPYRAYRSRPAWVRAALLGLVSFVIGATALTAGELLFERSVGSPHERTTLIGGSRAPAGDPTGPPQRSSRSMPRDLSGASDHKTTDTRAPTGPPSPAAGSGRTGRRTQDDGSQPSAASPAPTTTAPASAPARPPAEPTTTSPPAPATTPQPPPAGPSG